MYMKNVSDLILSSCILYRPFENKMIVSATSQSDRYTLSYTQIHRFIFQQTRHIEIKLVYYWAAVCDACPTLNQHCFNVSSLLGYWVVSFARTTVQILWIWFLITGGLSLGSEQRRTCTCVCVCVWHSVESTGYCDPWRADKALLSSVWQWSTGPVKVIPAGALTVYTWPRVGAALPAR